MHPSPAQTRRIGVSAGQRGDGRGGLARPPPTGCQAGLSVGCRAGAPGSGTAQLGRCAAGAGGDRSVGAAVIAWRTTVRWASRVWRAWSSRVPMTAVTSCWTSGSTRSRTACPAGVRSTRRGGGRPGCAAASAGRLARPQGCGAAHRVFVAWPPQRQRRQLVAPGLEPAVTSSFHPLKEANTSPFSRSGTLK
jgi:hypothetical protein